MDPRRPSRFEIGLICIILLNALVTAYLVNTVRDQDRRIHALERNDKITQQVDNLNHKVDSLKSRVEGFFH